MVQSEKPGAAREGYGCGRPALTLATLRLPVIYTLLFALVDLALLLVFLGVNEASTGMLKAGGYVILVFAAVGVYLFFHMAQVATGGPAMPLGRPLPRT